MEKNLKKENNRQKTSKRIRIVVFGPESTGKTTMAKQLAAHYKATYVPEFARIYAEQKQQKGEKLTANDVVPIAKGQLQLEAAVSNNKVTICDTDLLQTLTYARIYYPEFKSETLEKYMDEHSADLYFLTYIDVPWEADGIRDLPQQREEAFSEFKQTLQTYNQPYVLLKGNSDIRFQKATAIIDKLLQEH